MPPTKMVIWGMVYPLGLRTGTSASLNAVNQRTNWAMASIADC